jgi:putative ABC transport system substrate-binding protein
MSALGWEEQRNISYSFRWAEGRIERLPALAQELVAEGVDLIVVTGNPGIKAAQDVTATIPVVGMSDDLVEGGLAVSMSRPGGNTTGVSIFATDLDAKRLEVLHECVPQARHIGILVDPTTTSSARQLDRAARDLSLELRRFAAKDPLEIERALDAVVEPPTGAVNVLASPVLNGAQSTIVRRLNEARLPSIYQWPETAVAGGLLGYGPRLVTCYSHLAGLVNKVLRGSRPSELPIEQPTKFELVINQQTAKALGLTIPPTLLARADEVIE